MKKVKLLTCLITVYLIMYISEAFATAGPGLGGPTIEERMRALRDAQVLSAEGNRMVTGADLAPVEEYEIVTRELARRRAMRATAAPELLSPRIRGRNRPTFIEGGDVLAGVPSHRRQGSLDEVLAANELIGNSLTATFRTLSEADLSQIAEDLVREGVLVRRLRAADEARREDIGAVGARIVRNEEEEARRLTEVEAQRATGMRIAAEVRRLEEDARRIRDEVRQLEEARRIAEAEARRIAVIDIQASRRLEEEARRLGAEEVSRASEVKKLVEKAWKLDEEAEELVESIEESDEIRNKDVRIDWLALQSKQPEIAADIVMPARIQIVQPLALHHIVDPLIRATDFRIITPMVGIAAGGEEKNPITYGVWASGFITEGKQRANTLEKKYLLDQRGFIVGLDSLVNEDNLIGFAYANSFLTKKYNIGENSRDKQDVTSHIFSLYGSHKFQSPYYVSAEAQFGKILLKEKRYNTVLNTIVAGKTNGYIYGGKLELGYNVSYENDLYLIPKISLSYHENKMKAFTESGTGIGFIFHDLLKAKRLAGNAGIELRKKAVYDNYNIVPSVYISLEKVLHNKNNIVRISNTDFAIDKMPLVSAKEKENANLMLGGKLSFYHNKGVEVDLGYDLMHSHKFLSHTASLKVKLNL